MAPETARRMEAVLVRVAELEQSLNEGLECTALESEALQELDWARQELETLWEQASEDVRQARL